MNTFVNGIGATNEAPIPGVIIRSTDQEPFENVEEVSKDEIVEFQNEIVVPFGIGVVG